MKRDLKGILGDLEEPVQEKPLRVEPGTIEPANQNLLKAYEHCLKNRLGISSRPDWKNIHNSHLEAIANSGVETVTGKMITQFSQAVIAYDGDDYFRFVTGPFLSALIRMSYGQGNNDFLLDLRQASPVDYLGYAFMGQKHRRLKVRVRGNLGHACWQKAVYCSTKIEGNVGQIGQSSGFSGFIVAGNLGEECFSSAWSLDIKITGNTGKYCIDGAKYCTVTVDGEPGYRFGASAKNTKFISLSKDTLNYIKQHAGKGCSFYLLKDRREVLIRQK